MRKLIITLAATLAMVGAGTASAADKGKFSIWSPDVKKGHIQMAQVFNSFGCKGGNISPALAWKGVPAKAKSLALQIYDPDAPTGSGFWHWVVFNIPASTTSLAAGASGKSMPAGSIESRTDYGIGGYGGPCPPPGPAHHYHIILSALDVPAIDGADANTSAAVIGFNLHFHTIKRVEIVALYGQGK